MVEDIRLIKNWDVAHLQDVYLMVFWNSVTEKVTELLGLQVSGADGVVDSSASQVGWDVDGTESMASQVGGDVDVAESLMSQVGEAYEQAESMASQVGGDVDVAESLMSQVGGDVDESESWTSQVGGADEKAESKASQTLADGELPEKLVAAGEALLAAIEAMMLAYRKVNFKAMSKAIRRKDEERDTLLREVKTMVATMAKMSTMPERQAAGKALQASIEQWQLDPKMEYTQEGTAVRVWLEVVAKSAKLTAAADVLELTDILARLGELNEEVSMLIIDRSNAVADKRSMQQRQKRKEAERSWRTFVMVLNAAAVMDADEHRYETLIGQLNQRLKEMKQQMRHKRRMNPRKRGEEGEE